MTTKPCILAIESSCDDTAAAVIINGQLRSNLVAGQAVHRNYGGVVPELASRAHQANIVPVVQQALQTANCQLTNINAVAFTQGPGLIGSLVVGCSYAKGLALGLQVPLIGVHHMQAHILAHFIEKPHPAFPFLCLTVSGGHTQLVRVTAPLQMQLVGQSLDDAAGEAFDKTAKMLGLPYPGGPIIDKLAQSGNPLAYTFPKPKAKGGFNFSFSGLKTAVRYFLRDNVNKNPNFIQENLADVCASVQHTIIAILIEKLTKAAQHFRITEIAIAGGVSANSALRQALQTTGKQKNWNTYIPKFEYCTDNAGMIAMAAHYKYINNDFIEQNAVPKPRWPLF